MTHWVMREDDNGQIFQVARYASRAAADAVCARFEAHGHKQSYWSERAG